MSPVGLTPSPCLYSRSAWKGNPQKTISSMLHSPVPYAPIMAHFPPAPRFKAQDLGMVKTYSLRREALRWCWRRNHSRSVSGCVAEISESVAAHAHPSKNPRPISGMQAYIVYLLGYSFGVPHCVKMLSFSDGKVGGRASSTTGRILR